MPSIPRDPSWESTLALRADPYRFIAKKCEQLGSDVFETRILLQKTVCMRGRDAAEQFYDWRRFIRTGAAPEPIVKTLFGAGGIQSTDGETHRRRKQMFLSLVTPERVSRLVEAMASWWHIGLQKPAPRMVLYDWLQEVLMRAACEWAGLPLSASEVSRRTRQVTALFDAAGSVGPRHMWARFARWRAENWTADFIKQVRAQKATVPPNSAVHAVAWHVEPDGELLSNEMAAVELLNVVRPIVAVSVFITFVALALTQYPECRAKVARGGEYVEWFVQEVRRFYPFFPSAAARVREDFQWRGYHFRKGTRAVLDLYGTNHDGRIWGDPEHFRPERFRDWIGDLFGFIPQGGGDAAATHRCPGEKPTIELMKAAVHLLTNGMRYHVPEQDLSIDMTRLPALPRSHFIISNVTTQNSALAGV